MPQVKSKLEEMGELGIGCEMKVLVYNRPDFIITEKIS